MADNPCMCESYEVGVATNALTEKSHHVLQSCVWGANDVVETHCYVFFYSNGQES